MGIGYQDVFLVTFLTHPGVIIPEGGIGMFKLTGNWAAIWQVFWYWVLALPFGKTAATAWTAFTFYMVFILFYAYFFLRTRMSK